MLLEIVQFISWLSQKHRNVDETLREKSLRKIKEIKFRCEPEKKIIQLENSPVNANVC